jgi:hypothetical protein
VSFLGAYLGATVVVTESVGVPLPIAAATAEPETLASEEHIEQAFSRLCEQFRGET